MDINKAWFELVLYSLQLGLKNKLITKEEYAQDMRDLIDLKNDSDEEISEQVTLYVDWRNEYQNK